MAQEATESSDVTADQMAAFLTEDGEIRRPSEVAPISARDEQGRFAPRVAPEPPAEEPAPAVEAEAEAPAPGPEAEEPQGLRTIADLAKAFELPEDELLTHLQFATGEGETTASLADAIAAYRTPIEDRVKARVDARAAELDAQHQERVAAAQAAYQKLESTAENLYAEGIARWGKTPNWDELRARDPVEFSTQWLDYQRHGQLLQNAIAELRSEEERIGKERQAAHSKWAESEKRALLELPEFRGWTDPKVAEAAIGDLGKYLSAQGFAPQLVNDLVDHRMVRVAWKAMQYDRLREKTALTKEKLKSVPKIMPVQARRAPENVTAKQRDAAFRRLRETGSVEDAARAVIAGGLLNS